MYIYSYVCPREFAVFLIISIYDKIELSLVLSGVVKRAIGHFSYWKIERHPTVDCSLHFVGSKLCTDNYIIEKDIIVSKNYLQN